MVTQLWGHWLPKGHRLVTNNILYYAKPYYTILYYSLLYYTILYYLVMLVALTTDPPQVRLWPPHRGGEGPG